MRNPQVVAPHEEILTLPRAREVGQSYLTSIWTFLLALCASFRIIYEYSPDLLLVNGPGTCLPLCVAARILSSLGISKRYCKIVFVESVCRVVSLSLTGKILYHLRIAETVCVQWKALSLKYKRSEYVGVQL